MKNISTQYQDLLEGKMTKHQFLRNARMMFPSFVTNHNSFADSVSILKTKGMLVEGNAVKGTPDKEPTYDSPTPDAKTKYKKVEQSPEVDEQDGIYPATTLTDIPKVKTNKKVKDISSGLEPIKDNDTKNEMKKVKVVKENLRSFDDIFGDFIETDDATEIKTYIKTKGKEALSKIKSKLPALKDAARTKLAKLMKVELDEVRSKKTPSKELDIRERLKPAIAKLVQEVLDEMSQK
jgi:hypothetical protein